MLNNLINRLKEDKQSNRERFNKLVIAGYRLIKLTANLTPMSSGWKDPGFIYETEFQEGANYGIVGGSEHVCANGEKGNLIFIDFDPKEKTTDDNGNLRYTIHKDAVIELENVLDSLNKYPLYQDRTKNNGAHIGIITNERIVQGVNNYKSQKCNKLHVDIRTEVGYVVAIASDYTIEKIPDQFSNPINNFKKFMTELGFIPVNEISSSREHIGSLSEKFKIKARKMIKKINISEFPEFGTNKVGTHDVIAFLAMSQRSLKVPEDEAVEKIMELLSQINTSKDTPITEQEIHKMYNKDYEGFEETETISSEIINESERIRRESKETPIQQIERYLNTQIKNDPKLVSQLLRVCLSAYTNDPMNIALLAPSSDGKTYATVKVTEIFPKEDVIAVGRMSPTALIHQHGELIDKNGNSLQERLNEIDDQIKDLENKSERDNLKHQRQKILNGAQNCVDLKNKILLFLDNPNTDTYEMLKPIMSHDKKEIVYKTTKGDGSLNVKETVIRNWPVFIFCSAKNEDKNKVWEEIKTRVLMTSPESTVKKYKEANQLTAQKMGLPSWASSVYHSNEDESWAKWYTREFRKNLNDYCKMGNPVLNLFYNQLADVFPHSQGDLMRHFTRLCSFVNLETMLNADNRPVYELNIDGIRNRTIITAIEDIEQAGRNLGQISNVPPEKIKFYNQVFCTLFERKEKEDNNSTIGGVWVTSSELATEYTKRFEKTTDNKKIVENYLEPLVDAGVIEVEKNPSKMNQNLYRKSGGVSTHTLSDVKSKIIDESKSWESSVVLCLENIVKFSIKTGKYNEILKYNNQIINLEQLLDVLSGKSSKSREV